MVFFYRNKCFLMVKDHHFLPFFRYLLCRCHTGGGFFAFSA